MTTPQPVPDKTVEEVERLIEESSLGTAGARQLRDRADAVTVAKIRGRAYFDGCPADRSWWDANHRNPKELLRKARELAAAGETAISSVLELMASELLPDDTQGQRNGTGPVARSRPASAHAETRPDWRTFEAFYGSEIGPLTQILCERANLTLGLGRKLIGEAMVQAFDDWEHLAASGDPGEWVVGCALQLHKSREASTGDDSWLPTRGAPAGIGTGAPSPTHGGAVRVAGALAVAASEVPDTLPAASALESVPAEWDSARAVTALYTTHYRGLIRLAVLLVRDVATA
jgi:hypothetical protein